MNETTTNKRNGLTPGSLGLWSASFLPGVFSCAQSDLDRVRRALADGLPLAELERWLDRRDQIERQDNGR